MIQSKPATMAKRNAPRKGGDGPIDQVKASDPPPVGAQKYLPVTISLAHAMIDRLDDKAHSMRQTRSAAIRILLEEALTRNGG